MDAAGRVKSDRATQGGAPPSKSTEQPIYLASHQQNIGLHNFKALLALWHQLDRKRILREHSVEQRFGFTDWQHHVRIGKQKPIV
jgi:hypothetical protein